MSFMSYLALILHIILFGITLFYFSLFETHGLFTLPSLVMNCCRLPAYWRGFKTGLNRI
jgi:hypothetical protein